MHWPNHINDKGELRHQFHHVVDIAPTILELAGIPEPNEVDCVGQNPMEGVSFAYTLNDSDATERRIFNILNVSVIVDCITKAGQQSLSTGLLGSLMMQIL
jgi:arylsulfatase A-like enzyme